VHFLGVFSELNLIVIRVRISSGIRNRYRYVLAEVVGVGRTESRQRIDELANAGNGIATPPFVMVIPVTAPPAIEAVALAP